MALILSPLGLGCWIFDPSLWTAERERGLMDTMRAAVQGGVTHLDTATGYGDGASEQVVGRFLAAADRSALTVASKANQSDENPQTMFNQVRRSLERLQTDFIDLYYLHWPRQNLDLRTAIEGLAMARERGLIGAVGVSNFDVDQLQRAAQVTKIDALQIPYNLFWRSPEQEVIPYCREHGIAVVTYGSIGMGILTGKFPRQLDLRPGDQRNGILFFQEPTWGAIYEAVQEMKILADAVHRPLQQLAIRWSIAQPGIVCALVGANSPQQAAENAAALQGDLPAGVLEEMSAISQRTMSHIPAERNPYRYTPD